MPVRLCLIGAVVSLVGFFETIGVVLVETSGFDCAKNGVASSGFGNTAGVPSGCSSSHLGL